MPEPAHRLQAHRFHMDRRAGYRRLVFWNSLRPFPNRRCERVSQVDWGMLEKAIRTVLRTKHYALKTEKAYVYWIRQFVRFHHERRPSDMGGAEIHQFLSHLAINERVAASTQNQAA